jgi:hypothetical protein
MPAARSRSAFVRDAAKYAKTCAEEGVPWEVVEPKITGGFEIAGLEPTQDESMALYEAWDSAFPWPEKTAA